MKRYSSFAARGRSYFIAKVFFFFFYKGYPIVDFCQKSINHQFLVVFLSSDLKVCLKVFYVGFVFSLLQVSGYFLVFFFTAVSLTTIVLFSSNVDFFISFLLVRLSSRLFSCFCNLFYFLGLSLLFANLICIGDKQSSFSFLCVYLLIVCEASAKLMRLLSLFDLGDPHSMVFIQNVQILQNLFLQLSLITMSFYLVNQPLSAKVSIPKVVIIFSSIFQIKPSIRALVTIDSNSFLRIYDLNRGQVLLQVSFKLNKQPLQPLLKAQVCNNLIMLISSRSFYFINLKELKHQLGSLKQAGQKQVKYMKIIKKSTDVSSTWYSMFNKQIKLINKGQKICAKMSGRNNKIIKYCFGILDQQKLEFNITYEWQTEFGFEYNMSLQSLVNNFIIYQTYCNKKKHINVFVSECIHSQENKEQFLLSEISLIHFYSQISIIDVALLNDEVLCAFGNNSYEEASSSLMIVYNIRIKCTLNYLNFKEASIERLFWFMHTKYQFTYNYSLVEFDAVEVGENSSLIYQLYPQSYETDQNFKVMGKVLEISKDFIITRSEDEILIYPKLHKQAIYYKWLNMLGIHELQSLSMIAQFLQ